MNPNKKVELIKCGCGCSQSLTNYDSKGRLRKFIRGHYSKLHKDTIAKHLVEYSRSNIGKTGLWTKEDIKVRASRYRALRILRKLGITECQAKNEYYCKGKLEAHHIDKDPLNNEISNLNLLCRTHHKLADLRNLKLEELRNFNVEYIISSGIRRYKKKLNI